MTTTVEILRQDAVSRSSATTCHTRHRQLLLPRHSVSTYAHPFMLTSTSVPCYSVKTPFKPYRSPKKTFMTCLVFAFHWFLLRELLIYSLFEIRLKVTILRLKIKAGWRRHWGWRRHSSKNCMRVCFRWSTWWGTLGAWPTLPLPVVLLLLLPISVALWGKTWSLRNGCRLAGGLGNVRESSG